MARKCVGDFLRRQCQKRTLVLHKARIVSSSSDNAEVGPEATKRFFEFFTVSIRNKNTRIAYYQAIGQFL